MVDMGGYYFLQNKEWYYFDETDSERGIKLTEKAPPEAVESYNRFYEEADEDTDE